MFRRRPGFFFAIMISALSAGSCDKQKVATPTVGSELDSPYLLGATTGSANYIHSFGNEGTYPYHCRLHTSGQHRDGGIVFVTAVGAESAYVAIFEGKFRPESTTVRRGAQVRWQNFDDGTNHTITSD